MTNVQKLHDKIERSSLSHTAIAAALGMSMPTYYSRKSGKSEFVASEISTMTKLLGLTKAERDEIFFGE